MFRDPSPAARDSAFEQWKKSYSGKKAAADLKMSDMPRDKLPKGKCWDGYTESGAPTICLEGTSNNHGSHGLLHGETEVLMERHRAQSEMKYTQARSEIANAVHHTFGCDKAFIEKQLDEYYKNAYKCGGLKDAKITPHSGMSGGGPKTGGDHDTSMD